MISQPYKVRDQSLINNRGMENTYGGPFLLDRMASFIMKMKHAELLSVMVPFLLRTFCMLRILVLGANFIQQIMATICFMLRYLKGRCVFTCKKNILSELLRVSESHLRFARTLDALGTNI